MLALFFGCLLIAFGPAVVFLFSIVLNHSHLTILAIVAAFYELVGILITSLIWLAIPSTFSGATATALVLGVFFQETFRVLFVFSYIKGEKGLAKTTGIPTLPFTDFSSSVSSGFGFAVMYALLMFGSLLGLSTGEADFFSASCPSVSIFLVEAFATFGMEILHVSLMVLAFDAWRRKQSKASKFFRISLVFIFHLLASLSTLLNSDIKAGGCVLGMPLLFLTIFVTLVYTYKTVSEAGYHVKTMFENSE